MQTAQPVTIEAENEAAEALTVLSKLDGEDAGTASELASILTRPWLEGLLDAHDKISALKSSSNNVTNNAEEALLERLSHYSEPNIKIVRIEKTTEPLGATVKNEGEAVVVARIIRGGMAELSGLLHEGDELLEVNEIELRGKDVNEVCDILQNLQGSLTFLVVPTRHHLSVTPPRENGARHGVVHLKVWNTFSNTVIYLFLDMSQNARCILLLFFLNAFYWQTFFALLQAHIDYDPEDDPYVPCRELGISFQKNDILHVINQRDPHWWQARRDGEEDQTLAGLIPSSSFLAQREAMKHTLSQDAYSPGGGGGRGGSHSLGAQGEYNGNSGFRRAKSGFLCAKKSGRSKKNRKRLPYGAGEEEIDSEEILTYEEVALYYPQNARKRPVVLIGPPNIGRHELRQRLMLDTDRFAAAIPRKFFTF